MVRRDRGVKNTRYKSVIGVDKFRYQATYDGSTVLPILSECDLNIVCLLHQGVGLVWLSITLTLLRR